jgi:hypothetical protein
MGFAVHVARFIDPRDIGLSRAIQRRYRPAAALRPRSKLETAFHKADHSIQNIIQLLEAA